MLLSAVAFTFGLVRAVSSELPRLDPAKLQKHEVNGAIYDSQGRRVLAVLRGSEARTLVDTNEISDWMRHAIVDVEDKRFWEHNGVDIRGIARAAWADLRNQSVVEGGSTITQQFVKNALVNDKRTIARKVREAALAWQLSQRWSKDRILTAYLNTIYFGNGAYGVQQASIAYFGHGAKDLTLPEAALLAGIPANPTLYDPVQNPRDARERRRVVLRTMLDANDISRKQFVMAAAARMPRPQDVHLPGTQGQVGQYFVNYVKEQLIAHYGVSKVYGGGLKVRTTLDLGLQEKARRAIDKILTNPNGPAAALVAIDPRTGAVKAMVGGENYHRSQFNLAAQAKRQPGSTFKPFVLATALHEGIAPATRFESKPQHFALGGGRVWSPTNYDGVYLGNIDLETATIESDNNVYAQLTQLVGPKRVRDEAHALGVQSPLNAFYAIGLGVEEVNPLEMARAYAAFANAGRRIDGSLLGDTPRVITQVERRGKVMPNRVVQKQVLPEGEDALLTSILEKVVDEGTGVRARLPGRPAAGKTGTTDDYGDAWFVGYTPQLVAAIWIGYPTKRVPMLTEFHGDPVAGGTLPAEIWKTFMQSALKDAPVESFPSPPYLPAQPRAVVRRGGRLELDNGLCHSTREVVYFVGTGPARTADCKVNEVGVPSVVGRPLAAAKELLASQPLGARLVFKPARAGQRPGLVVDQLPKHGFLSAGENVILIVTKAQHGVVPDVVGSKLDAARAQLARLKIDPAVTLGSGPPGTVLSQTPPAGVAAAPGLAMRLVVARG